MKEIITQPLLINNTSVIALGESYYFAYDENGIESIQNDFEDYLNGKAIEHLIPLQIQFLRLLYDYFEGEDEDRVLADEYFMDECCPTIVQFIHQNDEQLKVVVEKWVNPNNQDLIHMFDLSATSLDRYFEIDYTVESKAIIHLVDQTYSIEFPPHYAGKKVYNQLFVEQAYYEDLMNDLKPIFTK